MKVKTLLYVAIGFFIMMNACVKDDLFNGPALISEVTAVPAAPKSSDSVSITARITDLKGIATAILAYRASAQGTFTSLAMQHETPYQYHSTIPAQIFGSKVEYFIEVKNFEGFTSRYPAVNTSYANYTVGASNILKLYINEVLSDGTKDASDPDWVEIYNASDIPADISGYAFYDEGIKTSGGSKAKRLLNAGTIIPSMGFLVLKTEYTSGEYAVEFGLSSTGDAVYLENASGVLVAALDFLAINLVGKKSYGRQPDGSNNLVIFNTPSRGTSND